MSLYRRLLFFCALLALGVVILGAWVRLSDAGLGCPDWPGCYGQWLGVPEHAADPAKAGKEMLHRYLAGTLGAALFTLCYRSWRQRPRLSPLLPSVLAGLVIGQALLGMWTVTLLLKPLIVSTHLLGGMSLVGLLVWLNLQTRNPLENRMDIGSPGHAPGWEKAGAGLRALGASALLLLIFQIALGGWVSSNYAALACPDFPTCQGTWLPAMDFPHAFSLERPLGRTADGAFLSGAALTAMHWSHRVGALGVTLVIGGLGFLLLLRPGWKPWGFLLLGFLVFQVGLGIANVLFSLPLPLAVAHNAGAALLLAAMVAVNFRLWHLPPRYGKAGMVGSVPLHSASG